MVVIPLMESQEVQSSGSGDLRGQQQVSRQMQQDTNQSPAEDEVLSARRIGLEPSRILVDSGNYQQYLTDRSSRTTTSPSASESESSLCDSMTETDNMEEFSINEGPGMFTEEECSFDEKPSYAILQTVKNRSNVSAMLSAVLNACPYGPQGPKAQFVSASIDNPADRTGLHGNVASLDDNYNSDRALREIVVHQTFNDDQEEQIQHTGSQQIAPGPVSRLNTAPNCHTNRIGGVYPIYGSASQSSEYQPSNRTRANQNEGFYRHPAPTVASGIREFRPPFPLPANQNGVFRPLIHPRCGDTSSISCQLSHVKYRPSIPTPVLRSSQYDPQPSLMHSEVGPPLYGSRFPVQNTGVTSTDDGEEIDRQSESGLSAQQKNGVKSMRGKSKFNSNQLSFLTNYFFNRGTHPHFQQCVEIGKEIGLTNLQVKVWFQNHRAKMRKQEASEHSQ